MHLYNFVYGHVNAPLLFHNKYIYGSTFAFKQERDFNRTIGINSDYIDTEDVYLSAEDSDFLVQVGQL